jgi:hypothetical protein
MAIYNTTNVKDLPQLEEVVNGNYLIIENQFGTNIIDFKDFVIGPDNASFYNTIISLCSYSVSMSATVNSQYQSLTATTLSAINTKVGALTANYPRYFEVYPNTISIPSGTKVGSTDFNSELGNIRINDVNVVPSNAFAGLVSYFVQLTSKQNPGNPPSPSPYTYTLRISAGSNVTGDATFETKVLKYF